MFNRRKPYFVSFTAYRISDGARVFGNCVVEATPIKTISHIRALELMIILDDPERNIRDTVITGWKRFE